jgi:formamidopyrimidine-DNA glycosylase
MPEGPEVRRYAVQLASALDHQPLLELTARTKDAKAWLLARGDSLKGRRIERIRSHGKHLFGQLEGEIGFHSHLMMWGRWFVHPLLEPGDELIEIDRRERARITTPNAIAILFSAPIFEIFEGDPYQQIENLRTLGPDILPYDGNFDHKEWQRRLFEEENLTREIGAVLLDQRVCAGIGNYLRADLLFFCQIDPWKRVGELSSDEIDRLSREIPLIARRAFEGEGVSVPPAMRARMLEDSSLSYGAEIREYGARHAVFRRTNLPCLVCGTPIKQKQQVVYRTPDGDDENEPGDEKARTIYFCPTCQNVDLDALKTQKKKRVSRKTAGV